MKSYVSPEYKQELDALATFLMSKKIGQTATEPTVQLPLPFYASEIPEFDDNFEVSE